MKRNLLSFSLVMCSTFIYASEEVEKEHFEPSYMNDTRFTLVYESDKGSIHSAYSGAVVVARAHGGVGKAVASDIFMNGDDNIFAIGQCMTRGNGKDQIKVVRDNLLNELSPDWSMGDKVQSLLYDDESSRVLERIAENGRERIITEYKKVLTIKMDDCSTAEEAAVNLTPMTGSKVPVVIFSLLMKDTGGKYPPIASIRTTKSQANDVLIPCFLPPELRRTEFGLNVSDMKLDRPFIDLVVTEESDQKVTDMARALLLHHHEKIKDDPVFNENSWPLITLINFSALSAILAQEKTRSNQN